MKVILAAAVMGVHACGICAEEGQRLNWKESVTAAEFDQAPKWQRHFDPDGNRRLLTLGEGTDGLPVPAGKVRWAKVLPAGEAARLKNAVQLIGDLGAETPAIEEISAISSEVPLLPVPAGVELKDHLDWKPFGIEERVENSDAASWVIKTGKKPAGLYSAHPWRLPKAAGKSDWVIDLTLEGEGEVQVGVATRRGREFGDAIKLENARLTPQGAKTRIACPVPSGAEVRICFVSLQPASRFRIQSLVFRPAKAVTPRAVPRGVWNWSGKSAEWNALLPAWREARISSLLLALPRSMDESTTRTLAEMRKEKFRVVAVEGDPHMVLQPNQSDVLAKSRELTKGKGTWLDALQYDVEPYLLPGFQLESERWRDQWSILFNGLSKASGGAVEAVVPYWLLQSEAGRALLQKLSKSVARIAVMNYRSGQVEFCAQAAQWLEWSMEQKCPVSIAVECGPIPDLQSSVFREKESGTLWISEWKGVGTVVVLFDQPIPKSESAKTFALERQGNVPGNRTTLQGRPGELAAIEKAFTGVVSAAELPEKLQPMFLIHEPTAEDLKALQPR